MSCIEVTGFYVVMNLRASLGLDWGFWEHGAEENVWIY
jgi:hypothetical protein